jgi:signal transduction histidine kinase
MSYELFAFFGTLLVIFLVIVLIAYALEFSKRQNKHYKEKELMNAHFQQELLKTQLEIQEQTFRNISQEIHDNIGQVLTLAKLNINTMPDFNSTDLKEKISDTSELVTKAIQDLRDLSKSLNTEFVAEMGLIQSIEYELNLLKKISGVETTLTQEGTTCHLSHQNELILFRIFQEALNNIMKHSGATLVNVIVNFSSEKFVLRVADNGKGFDVEDMHEDKNGKQGLGLRNMENRSRIIGASYSIMSQAGKGTTVTIELPIAS